MKILNLLIIFSLFTLVLSENDSITEIIIDISIGSAIAICEQYRTCHMYMTIISLITFILLTIIWIIDGCNFNLIFNKKNFLKAGTMTSGYHMTKMFINN